MYTTGKQSTIPIRLVSPYPEIDFMGRIEVFYDDQWGTICNDFFYVYYDGNVVCQMLNFTQGAACIPPSYNSFGQGTGKFLKSMCIPIPRLFLGLNSTLQS